MKKIFLLAVSILMVTLTFGQTVDPIPSYNVLVTGKANFTDNSTISTTGTQPLNYEKRDVNVSSDGGGSNTPSGGGSGSPIVVYVYTLDRTVVLGPFFVPSGQTLTVPIDQNAWGVLVGDDSPTYVSVWEDDGNE